VKQAKEYWQINTERIAREILAPPAGHTTKKN